MTSELEEARQLGRIEGQLEAVEKMQATQNTRIDEIDKRLKTQERIVWAILGAIGFIQSIDVLKQVLHG